MAKTKTGNHTLGFTVSPDTHKKLRRLRKHFGKRSIRGSMTWVEFKNEILRISINSMSKKASGQDKDWSKAVLTKDD